jgi:preprotein translocase subunit SecA
MMQFQQDTSRHLFRMQIIGPDGNPIETADQMPPRPPAGPPVLEGSTPQRSASSQENLALDAGGDGRTAGHAPVPIQTRAPSTTIDELEREFERKKKRELEQARMAGTSEDSNGSGPRVTGEKVGRNDPCPCGSGKKYKKCHGTQEQA